MDGEQVANRISAGEQRSDYGPAKLVIKGAVLLFLVVTGIVCPRILTEGFFFSVGPVRVYHVIWAAAIIYLINRLTPKGGRKIASTKCFDKTADTDTTVTAGQKSAFFRLRKNADRGALHTALSWTAVIGAAGILHRAELVTTLWLFAIVMFFIFMDQFCITVWCPFQWLMKNKCCATCRINNWGYLMAFAPLLYIPSFWTYSVLVVSAALVVQWEYLYYRYPERFYEAYNKNLACVRCREKKGCRR